MMFEPIYLAIVHGQYQQRMQHITDRLNDPYDVALVARLFDVPAEMLYKILGAVK